MGKYFGTDGIRGIANESLTIETALKVGTYLGYKFKGGKLIIGQDTRLSGYMYASAIAAGAISAGCDVYILGVCATPALAHIILNEKFDTGVMISASHNPYYDNGLKCFNSEGMKISEELENEIEQYMDGEIEVELAKPHELGELIDFEQGLEPYLQYLEGLVNHDLSGYKIVLDLAHGSATSSAERVFKDLGADVIILNNEPNGTNINKNCGSTHIDVLQEKVLENKADIGFAFDGDADRCLAVDENGQLVDGDQILYILGNRLNEEGNLKDNVVVSTVMANLGFLVSSKKQGLDIKTTQVGDKYVFALMNDNNYTLGGEQSGHIIIKEHATTGDGVLTALVLADTVVKTKKSLAELSKDCERYPQVLKNINIIQKDKVMNHPEVISAIDTITQELQEEGRILVRPSGTEPLIRVMVEAKSHDLCERYVNDMIKVIETVS